MTRLTAAGAFVATAMLAMCGCGSSRPKSVFAKYPSLRVAAASISHHCTRDFTSSNSNGLLWLRGGARPLVYYASAEGDPPEKVLNTRGPGIPPWGLLWPCDPPVVIHYPSTRTASVSSTALLTVLASKPSERKTIGLGRIRLANPENWNTLSGYANGLIAPDGRIIFFSGTTIRYAGGPEFSVHGLPHGWQIGALVVSPRNRFVFLAVAEKGRLGSEPCPAAVYLITPTTTTRLKRYDGCMTGLTAQWSPDGREIAWFVSPGGNATQLLVSDAEGRQLRELVPRDVMAVWSPDSKSIAYSSYRRGSRWTAVVDVSTGARHLVAKGDPLAWSPDGTQIALIRQSTVIPRPAGSIVAVPAAGGRAHLLFRVPPAPSG
jgi:dipeptidyl aminopeptidase/acylaminoacyl peptidase